MRQDQLIVLAMLLGCDYTLGVHGVGIVNGPFDGTKGYTTSWMIGWDEISSGGLIFIKFSA